MEEERAIVPGESLPPAHHDLDLYSVANTWADILKKGPSKDGYAMKFKDYGSKGVPRNVPGDDNLRRVVETEDLVITQVSPTTTNFFSVYDKKRDLLHFIVNGQAALVPPDWLLAYTRGLRRTQRRLGFGSPLGIEPTPKVTPLDRIKYCGRMLKQAFFQPKAQPTVHPELSQIERDKPALPPSNGHLSLGEGAPLERTEENGSGRDR